MPYLSSETLKTMETLFSPFDADQITNGSVELRMGPEAYVTGGAVGMKTELSNHGAQIVIPPGQFALLLTEESVSIPVEAIAFISIKYRFKLHGLVNVSGFHVDPGFEGQLIFAVYNAGGHDLVISRGDRVFLMWVASLDRATGDPYNGGRAKQDSIRNEDIMAIGRAHYSTAEFNDRLNEVQARLNAFSRTVTAMLIGIALLIAGVVADRLNESDSDDPARPSVSQSSPAAIPSGSTGRTSPTAAPSAP